MLKPPGMSFGAPKPKPAAEISGQQFFGAKPAAKPAAMSFGGAAKPKAGLFAVAVAAKPASMKDVVLPTVPHPDKPEMQ